MDGQVLIVISLLLSVWLAHRTGADGDKNSTFAFQPNTTAREPSPCHSSEDPRPEPRFQPNTTAREPSPWESPTDPQPEPRFQPNTTAREPSPWESLTDPRPEPRFFIPDRTLLGRRIPGLAKESNCCGIANNFAKIAGGTATRPNQFPWTAALVLPGLNIPFCSGTLINDRYVVTAAHCVVVFPSPQLLQVILGKHELNQNSGNDLRLEVERIIIHPKYGSLYFTSDIALLKLRTILDLPIGNNLIAPLCLPTRSPFFYKDAVLAGWGVQKDSVPVPPDRLHSVQLRVISNKLCRAQNAPLPVLPNMICAQGTVGQGACYGDWGSALMVADSFRPPRLVLLGVFSWGIGCARPRRPSVYIRVTSFLDWLVINTADANYYC